MIEMEQRPRITRQPADQDSALTRLDLTRLEADGLRRYLGSLISRAGEGLMDDGFNFVDDRGDVREKVLATRDRVRAALASIRRATQLLDGELGWSGEATLTHDDDLAAALAAARDYSLEHMRECADGGDWYEVESVQEAAIIALADRVLGVDADIEPKVRVLVDGALVGVRAR